MSDVLSQNEIDSLLAALQSGDVTAEQVKNEEERKAEITTYDFKNPQKFAQDQMRTLEIIYEQICRNFTTTLSTNLRLGVAVEVANVEQISYDELTRSLPEPTVLGVFTMDPLERYGLIDVSPSIAFLYYDRMLGGQGNPLEQSRALTDIEMDVIENEFFPSFFEICEEAWSRLIEDIKIDIHQIETNPQVIQIVSPNDIIILLSLSVKVGEIEGLINVAMPYIMLEPIVHKLSTRYLYSNPLRSPDPRDQDLIKGHVNRAKVEMRATFKDTEITLEDLIHLEVGDIIQLDHKIKENILVRVGSHIKFSGAPGKLGKNMAVEILEDLEEDLFIE